MRIFVFGPSMGIISAICLGRWGVTLNHPNYKSTYYAAAFSLLGIALVWCTFPFLTLADLYNISDRLNNANPSNGGDPINFSSINYALPGIINMWLALCAGILGAFTISFVTYQKAHIYDIIFSAVAVILQII